MDRGKTHWEGCETEHGHSGCAARAIEDLKRELAEARENCEQYAYDYECCAEEREALRAESARLLKLIDEAPHGVRCSAIWHYEEIKPGPCDCWKSAARRERAREGAGGAAAMSMPDVIYPTAVEHEVGGKLVTTATYSPAPLIGIAEDPYYSKAACDERARRVAERAIELYKQPYTHRDSAEQCIDAALREAGGKGR